MSLNTTPRTWVTGEVVTAAELNTEVRDGFTGIQAAWTAYTPTLSNITLGNGTLTFKSARVGKTIIVRGRFVAGSTTTYSAGALAFSLPATPSTDYAAAGDWPVGSGMVKPTTVNMGVTVWLNGSGNFQFVIDNATTATTVTNTAPGTFGTSAEIGFTAEYEAA